MITPNRKLGNNFESTFCEILFQQGFWCHNLAQNQAGQPADVIAVRNGKSYLIDCKVCSRGRFPFSRIEDNQHCAMSAWQESGNGKGWFALLCSGHIFMLDYETLARLAKTQSSISYSEMCFYGYALEAWVVFA